MGLKVVNKSRDAFALPTVLIGSMIMMIVLLVAVSATASIRLGLQTQIYNSLARGAAQAGTAYAESCLSQNDGVASWSDENPLTPYTDCEGQTFSGLDCSGNTSDADCYLISRPDFRISFSVGSPEFGDVGEVINLPAQGLVQLLRSSNQVVWRTYNQTVNQKIAEAYKDDGLPIGSSIEGYWQSPPPGYLLEDGSAVSRTEYADLFALIGTTFGVGNGSTTFNLPDSRGRATVNLSSSDSEFDSLGEKYGANTVTLTIAQMPAHNHGGSTGSSAVGGDIGNNFSVNSGSSGSTHIMAGSDTSSRYTDDLFGTTHSHGINTAGSDNAHNNIQKSITKQFAIKYIKSDPAQSKLSAGTSIAGYWPSTPSDYLAENGAAVSRTTYSNLFSAIGTTHGAGDGSTTFNVPDSRGRLGVNINSSEASFDQIGEKTGTKTHTLTVNEMPAHDHGGATVSDPLPASFSATSGSGSGSERNRARIGSNSSGRYSAAINQSSHTHTIPSQGDGEAHNNIQPSIAKRMVIKYTPAAAERDNIRPGTSIYSYYSSAPAGYLFEDGSAVSRTEYPALFAVIGTTYGAGDGSTTFNVPDSRGRTGVNLMTGDEYFGIIGQLTGSSTHTLTLAELPAHDHGGAASSGTLAMGFSSANGASGSGRIRSGASLSSTTNVQASSHAHSISSQGGGQAHNNIQPSIVKKYFIKY